MHVARTQFYVDHAIHVAVDVKDAFQHAFAQSYLEMVDIAELAGADDGAGLLDDMVWIDFVEDERTWEPIEYLCRDVPNVGGKI